MPAIIAAVITALGVLAMMPALAMLSGTLAYFLWNYMAPVYLTFLPVQYLHLPWWHCVCLLWLMQIINPFNKVTNTSK